MASLETIKLLNDLCEKAVSLQETVEKADRNNKSLTSRGFYATKFHDGAVAFGAIDARVSPLLPALGIDEAHILEFKAIITELKRPAMHLSLRIQNTRKLKELCHARLIPAVEASEQPVIPHTESVLPFALVKNTASNIAKHTILQANGCYEKKWFDACSVMMRKFVECLIIAAFEAEEISDRIKGDDDNYLMLGDLISAFLRDSTWNLGRDTKRCLPLVKELGDRSAHNRTFMAIKPDVDKVLASGFRVAAEELLERAKLK